MRLYPEQESDSQAASFERTQRSGFVENWNASLGLAISEDLPVLSRMVSTTVESQRNNRIQSAMDSGEIPMGISEYYDGDSNGLAGYARDVIGLEGFITDDEYEEKRQQEYAMMREYSASVTSRASASGVIGQMAGYAHAMAVDPIYASSFLTGYGTAATIGQAALRVGLTEAAIETVAQVPKLSWKEEIGAEYSAARAVTEIAFAGLGAGAIAWIGKAIGVGLRKVATPKDLTVEQGTEVLIRMAKDNPELEPIINTLRHADPNDNMMKVLQADEAVDINRATSNPRTGIDPKADPAIKKADIMSAEEAAYLQRQPQKIEVGDRVNVLDKTSAEKTAKYAGESAEATRKVKSATKKYNKAKERAAKLSKAADAADDSVAGGKAKKAALEAEKAMNQAEANLTSATEKEAAAKALSDEAAKTAEEGVPRGTPEKKEAAPPKPDDRHYLVVEADALVEKADATIKIMEECF